MSEQKQYVPGVYVEQRDKPFWKLNVQSANAQKLIEFIKANTDAKGRIHFCITELREPKERQTHSMWLDTWRPDSSRGGQTTNAPRSKVANVPSSFTGENAQDDPPI